MLRSKFCLYVWLREWSIQIKFYRLMKLQNCKQFLGIHHCRLAHLNRFFLAVKHMLAVAHSQLAEYFKDTFCYSQKWETVISRIFSSHKYFSLHFDLLIQYLHQKLGYRFWHVPLWRPRVTIHGEIIWPHSQNYTPVIQAIHGCWREGNRFIQGWAPWEIIQSQQSA